MNLQLLEMYMEGQVVVNTYLNDELIDKNGFYYEKIKILDNSLNFIKDQELIYSISIEKYPTFRILEDYKNYFSFSNEKNEKIEIYFP